MTPGGRRPSRSGPPAGAQPPEGAGIVVAHSGQNREMDALTLALHERLLLIALDDDKGRSRSQFADTGLAGAVMLDLVRAGAISVVDDKVVPGEHSPAAGVLTEAAGAIGEELKPRSVRWWVDHLPRRLKPFQRRLATRLLDSGVLAEEHHKVLGIISTTRLPERDHQPEAQVRERLRAVLLDERPPDEDDAILAGFVNALDLVGLVVGEKLRTKEAKRRAKELGQASEFNVAVGEAIRAAQAAVMAAIIASTVASTAGASGG